MKGSKMKTNKNSKKNRNSAILASRKKSAGETKAKKSTVKKTVKKISPKSMKKLIHLTFASAKAVKALTPEQKRGIAVALNAVTLMDHINANVSVNANPVLEKAVNRLVSRLNSLPEAKPIVA